MTAWWFGSLCHFLLIAHWIKRARTAQSRDEFFFQTVVLGLGTLSIALHLIASTVGLTLWRVLLVLAAGHAVAWYARHHRRPLPSEPRTGAITRTLEFGATVTLVAIVIQWMLLAGQTAEVSGSDAAHYHVPNAINLALGASPFDLPATNHLYPMGSSALAAWFLLPVRTPLLIDLVMVLPFLLLIAASCWLFRQVTSVSGLAWCTWMMVALFATPLFRAASLMSADLLFAAATIAFVASILSPLIRRTLAGIDVWLIGLSLGLLLGSKVTDLVAAVLLGVPALVTWAVLKLRRQWTMEVPALMWGGAIVAVIGSGGLWLIRNWWVWGSPVAPNGVTLFGLQLLPGVPYEPTTYLSVLGDMREKPDYSLWERTRHFIEVWLSPWYLPGLLLLLLIPLDAIRNRGRSVRLAVVLVISSTAAVVAWFLIGAPWTSLEWTEGFSLRYALPWLVLLPLAAWIALFPDSWPWYQRPVPSSLAGLLVVTTSLVIFSNHQPPAFPPGPTVSVLLAAIALIIASALLQYVPRAAFPVAVGAMAVASFILGTWTKSADLVAQDARATAIANGPRTNGERLFDTAIAFEAKEGRSCDAQGRRFFVTNRFDEAGTLQGPQLRNQVFYAARDVKVTSRVRPPMGPCDYLLTERAIMGTIKGAALHQGLNPSGSLVEVGLVGDVVLLVHR